MNKTLLLLILMSPLMGCESVSVEPTPSLYPQRDLTIRWPERQYWQAPASFTGVQTPHAADTDGTPRSAPVTPAAAPVKATGRKPRPGRRLRTACAKKGSC